VGICIEKELVLLWAKVKETVMSAIRRHDGRVYLLWTQTSCLLLVGTTVASLANSIFFYSWAVSN